MNHGSICIGCVHYNTYSFEYPCILCYRLHNGLIEDYYKYDKGDSK